MQARHRIPVDLFLSEINKKDMKDRQMQRDENEGGASAATPGNKDITILICIFMALYFSLSVNNKKNNNNKNALHNAVKISTEVSEKHPNCMTPICECWAIRKRWAGDDVTHRLISARRLLVAG